MAQARRIHPVYGDPTAIFAPAPGSGGAPSPSDAVPANVTDAWDDLRLVLGVTVPTNVNNARASLRRLLAQRR